MLVELERKLGNGCGENRKFTAGSRQIVHSGHAEIH